MALREYSHNSGQAVPPLDVLCVGFGVSSLAVAVALADRTPEGNYQFLDQASAFSWRQGQVCPDNKVQTSFLRDLVTTCNPRSYFSYTNYLFQKSRLAAYTNVSSICPTKLEMQYYLLWAAKEIEKLGWVSYGRQVVQIEPVKLSSGRTSQFAVHYRDAATGRISMVLSKRVIVATPPKLSLPTALSGPTARPFVVVASESHHLFSGDADRSSSIAIVGASQEGAEIFEHLQSYARDHRATMFVQESTLRPLDNSAFSRGAADQPRQDMAHLPPDLRQKILRDQPGKSPISLALVERLYEMDYAQRIGSRNNDSLKRFNIEMSCEVVGTEVAGAQVRLLLKDTSSGHVRLSAAAFDHIIAASGEYASSSDKLLAAVLPLAENGSVHVGRDYQVNLRRGAVATGRGVWLLESLCNDMPREEMFLYLAEMGQRVSESLFKAISDAEEVSTGQVETHAML